MDNADPLAANRPSWRWRDLRIGLRIAIGYTLLTLFTVAVAGIGWSAVQSLSAAITFVTGPAWSTADGAMEGAIGIEKQMLAVERLAAGTNDAATARQLLDAGTEMADEALGRARDAGLIAAARHAEMQSLRQRFDAARVALWRAAEAGSVPKTVFQDYRATADALLDNIDELEALGDSQVEGYVATSEAIVSTAYTEFATAMMAAIIVGFVAARTVITSVTRPLAAAVRVANRVSAGHLDEVVHIDARDETGELLAALRAMQTELRSRIEREAAQAEDVRKIQAAMHQASAAMMLVDTGGQILFTNHSMQGLADRLGLHGGLDGPVGRLLGRAANGATQATLTQQQPGEYSFAGRIVEVRASPVRGDSGSEIGTVLEWTDLTAQRSAERELGRVLEDARHGELRSRLDESVMHGVMGELARSVNAMLDALVSPVQETQRVMRSLAAGDLTEEISGTHHGEFAQMQSSVNASIRQLRSLIENIRAGADQIAASSADIRNGNLDLSARTERQATSVQQTASNVVELTDMVRRNTDQARRANEMAADAAQAAQAGGEVVGRAVHAMDEIDRTSKEIADIIGVVDQIAFQTNLLALNASVEAARAGEQGRGFAVVAAEVRNLAQRSAGAARQIRDLISASVTRVDEGAALVRESGTTLGKIVDSVGAVSHLVSGIADASAAQCTGIQRVSETLREIDDGTQQNAAMVEEVAAASTSMDEQAAALRQRVAAFRIGTDGQPGRTLVR